MDTPWVGGNIIRSNALSANSQAGQAEFSRNGCSGNGPAARVMRKRYMPCPTEALQAEYCSGQWVGMPPNSLLSSAVFRRTNKINLKP